MSSAWCPTIIFKILEGRRQGYSPTVSTSRKECNHFAQFLSGGWGQTGTNLRSLQANTAITLPSFFPRGVSCAFMSFRRVRSRWSFILLMNPFKTKDYMKSLLTCHTHSLGDKEMLKHFPDSGVRWIDKSSDFFQVAYYSVQFYILAS